MTTEEFTAEVHNHVEGIWKAAALHAAETQNCDAFIQELIDQDNDPGSRNSVKRMLGDRLYNELQKFKTAG